MNDPTSDPELWQLDTIMYLIDELPARHLDWLLDSPGLEKRDPNKTDNISWWIQDYGKASSLIETLEHLIAEDK
jgi:hypothetical protein